MREKVKNERIKILHIITSSDMGGAQKHLLLLLKGISKAKYDITVACGSGGHLIDELELMGIKVIVVPNLIRQINPIKDSKAAYQLYKLIKEGKYNIVHSHSSKAGLLGRFSAWLARVPLNIFTAHGFVFSDFTMSSFKRSAYLFLEKLMAYISDVIITVSYFDKKIAINKKVAPKNKLVVIQNGIDIKPFAKEPTTKIANHTICIGTITRLVHEKGLFHLLEALALIKAKNPNVELSIVGDGYLRESLVNHAKHLGIADCVNFKGYQNDVISFLFEIDIFVLSSVKEGLPLALLEAMAAGKAIVATHVGGIPEVLASDRGIVVPPSDPKQIAKSVLKLSNDSNLRVDMGNKAKAYVKEKHDYLDVSNQVEKVYDDFLG